MTDLPEISVETVRTYRRTAITCAVLHGDAPYFNDCCVRAGLAAVVPLIRAQVAAERRCPLCNPGSPEEIRQREEASAELDRLVVDDDEDLPPGVHRERDGFLVMERNGPPPNLDDYGPPVVIAPLPDEPVADVVAAFEAGEKGVTGRPMSNREFIAAEVERLGLQPKVDRLWAEVENGPPMPVGWCTWHQMVDCHGDAAECCEARAEIAGGDGRG